MVEDKAWVSLQDEHGGGWCVSYRRWLGLWRGLMEEGGGTATRDVVTIKYIEIGEREGT